VPTLPLLLLRADGGPGIGSGHIGRCLALAQGWQDLHGTAELATLQIPEHWRLRFGAEGIEIGQLPGRATPIEPRRIADWCAVDTYRSEKQELAWAHEHAERVLHIADNATAPSSDLTLNQNLLWPARPEPSPDQMLTGPRYALIRSELRIRIENGKTRTRPRGTESERDRALTLLVSLGGEPGATVRRFSDSVLSDPRLSGLRIRLLEGVADVGDQMAEADLAFAAAGSTAWELSGFGVPMVLFAAADNQVAVAETLAGREAAFYAGLLEDNPVKSAVSALLELSTSTSRRSEMGLMATTLIDGKGALRTATRLRAEMLHPRPASAEDSALLWDWANDKVTRESSFSSGQIQRAEHESWLSAVLSDPRRRLYVMEDPENVRIGQVRFDTPTESHASRLTSSEISFSLSPTSRGLGWGGALIDSAVRRYFEDSEIDLIVARTLHANSTSQRALVQADFDEVGQHEGSPGWREFHRHRNAARG
jgi:UDP-2,4-diacetamido-2,4,6-trideoxy-beta-L-altropyranose hydrolase